MAKYKRLTCHYASKSVLKRREVILKNCKKQQRKTHCPCWLSDHNTNCSEVSPRMISIAAIGVEDLASVMPKDATILTLLSSFTVQPSWALWHRTSETQVIVSAITFVHSQCTIIISYRYGMLESARTHLELMEVVNLPRKLDTC